MTKKFRHDTLDRIRRSPTGFVSRNIEKLIRSPGQFTHDVRNLLRDRSPEGFAETEAPRENREPGRSAPRPKTPEARGGFTLSNPKAADQLAASLESLPDSTSSTLSQLFIETGEEMSVAYRDRAPRNQRFSSCLALKPSQMSFMEQLLQRTHEAEEVFIGNRFANLNLLLLPQESTRMCRRHVVEDFYAGLPLSALKQNAQNLVVVDPQDMISWLVWSVNQHLRLILWITPGFRCNPEILAEYEDIAALLVVPDDSSLELKPASNVIRYSTLGDIQKVWQDSVLTLGEKPRNMLVPAYRGKSYKPELFDAQRATDAVCYLRSQELLPLSDRFSDIVSAFSDRVESIYFREEHYHLYRGLIDDAMRSGDPSELLKHTLKAGMRYEFEAASSPS